LASSFVAFNRHRYIVNIIFAILGNKTYNYKKIKRFVDSRIKYSFILLSLAA